MAEAPNKMNTQSPVSPLVPQGSLLEQKNKGRARVKIAVFFVLAIHGIGLLALLMQGCRRDEGAGGGGGSAAPTNAVATPAFENTNIAVVEPVVTNTTPVAPAAPVAPTGGATDYKVVKGDTLATIATHHKVTLKALMDANPGVDPVKLQIAQTIHIPAPTAAPAATTTGNNGGATTVDAASGEKIYTVKTGDSLTKIAASQGTTIVKLRAANGLKTDAIKVGQKLKIPAGSTPPAGTNGTTPTTP